MFLTLKRLARWAAGCALAATLAPAQAAPWALTGSLSSHDPNLYKTSATWWI
ncbi:MAG: arabinan endo-1,5-alpha-L-arabinosidase, partial [Burkholderiales bacterium]|nr:arabinan endo-1,5-alpha-L-arabinosidase [Burkholderiales bacterium]